MDAPIGMDMAIGLFVMLVGIATFYLGIQYGREAEQYLVARALATFRSRYIDLASDVQAILRELKADYTKAYNEVVDEYEVIKKEL